MKLYENIVIGNFLYAFGFAVRARTGRDRVPGVVNLLQQTPADKPLGDLLLGFPGLVRLIEFKAETNRSKKEKARHTVLQAALRATSPSLEPVSRRVHWYVETAASAVQGVVARIVPYLDAFPRDVHKGDDLARFIEALATDVAAGGPAQVDEAEVEYLRWVARTQGGTASGAGALLLVAAADGGLRWVLLSDLLELRLTHREILAVREAAHRREMDDPAPQRGRARRREMDQGLEP